MLGASSIRGLVLLWACPAVVTAQFAQTARIGRMRFVNADTDSLIPVRLTPENMIDVDVIGTDQLNIVVETSQNTRSVRMTLDKPRVTRCETRRPFAIFTNSLAGPDGSIRRFQGRKLPYGNLNFTATPFLGPNCDLGTAGDRFQSAIQVLRPDSFAPPAPTKSPTATPSTFPTQTPPTSSPTISTSLQPKITTVESFPARKVAGDIILPEGSPWCDGNPTAWLPGHKSENDTPNCFEENPSKNWTRPAFAFFDNNDDLNDIDGPEVIDRHDCGALDVNNDGRLDVYCLVGANSGRGEGFNELYITRRNGSLRKVKRHGLQKHNGLRGRHTAVLNGQNGDQFVFIATKGFARDDDKSNRHHMYRKTGVAPEYFEEVKGPFNVHTDATCAYKVDVNDDGLDDLILCHPRDFGMLFVQDRNRTWRQIPWNQNKRQRRWRKVRVADFTGDGIPDLLAVYWQDKAKVRIFPGIRAAPYFDFAERSFEAGFPFAGTDIEVLDVNGDGILDFYVVQSDERREDINGQPRNGTYCAGQFFHRQWWARGNQPPRNFVPPGDPAPDVLFVGMGLNKKQKLRFQRVVMEHSEPGCGNLVRPFGERKLLLAQGDFVRPGHQLLLDWN